MASFYERRILPKLLTCACASPPMMKQRAKVVPLAQGRVLELGVGMGLNLALYDAAKVASVSGVDPAAELRAQAMAAPRDPRLNVSIADGNAEDLPFEDRAFDTVVCTFTLCSVHTPAAALAQARRVLKTGGRLLYCEHGLAPDPEVAKWQRRIEPLWKRVGGNCHLTRPISQAYEKAGFSVDRQGAAYMPKTPRPFGWVEYGAARAAS